MNHLGIQFDSNRIKVSTHKPIKKEDYLNLSKSEIDEEQYYRAGVKPKWTDEEKEKVNLTKVKYTIFRARSGRVLLLRKPVGGAYESIDSSTRCNFNKIKTESFRSMKRFKTSEHEEVDKFSRINSAALSGINEQYDDFIESDSVDSDEEITDDESKSDVDDYTEGFISRLRKRRGKKRGINDTTISFKLSNY